MLTFRRERWSHRLPMLPSRSLSACAEPLEQLIDVHVMAAFCDPGYDATDGQLNIRQADEEEQDDPRGTKVYLLRRLPRDPFASSEIPAAQTWDPALDLLIELLGRHTVESWSGRRRSSCAERRCGSRWAATGPALLKWASRGRRSRRYTFRASCATPPAAARARRRRWPARLAARRTALASSPWPRLS